MAGNGGASMRIKRILLGAVTATSIAVFSADAETAMPIPDFSGLWGRNAFDFEPAPGSPKPIDNLVRLPNGAGNASMLVGDYHNPLLKPEAAAVVKHRGDLALSGASVPDLSNQCAPFAPPFTFSMELGVQLLQAQDHITFVYNQDDQVRHVWLNRPHPTNVRSTAMGDSVGHYEGDTLVVDTVGITTGPLAMIDRYGTPRSRSAHIIERYRLIDGAEAKQAAERHIRENGPMGLAGAVLVDPKYPGKGLQLEIRIEDPEVFTTPWSAVVTYRRIIGPWLEQICAENTIDREQGRMPLMPVSAAPDF
jgi:hypothetical protein